MCPLTISNMNISKTREPIATKFYLKHHWGGGRPALGFGPDRIRKASYGQRQANLVLMAYASSKGSGEPVHPGSRACASRQCRQNLCCSLIQAVSQEEPSDRKPDPWPSEGQGMRS